MYILTKRLEGRSLLVFCTRIPEDQGRLAPDNMWCSEDGRMLLLQGGKIIHVIVSPRLYE